MVDPMVVKVEAINAYLARLEQDVKNKQAAIRAVQDLLAALGYGIPTDGPQE